MFKKLKRILTWIINPKLARALDEIDRINADLMFANERRAEKWANGFLNASEDWAKKYQPNPDDGIGSIVAKDLSLKQGDQKWDEFVGKKASAIHEFRNNLQESIVKNELETLDRFQQDLENQAKIPDPTHFSSTSQAAQAAPSLVQPEPLTPLDAAFEALADEKRREVDLALHGKISEVSIDGEENETKESGWTPFH